MLTIPKMMPSKIIVLLLSFVALPMANAIEFAKSDTENKMRKNGKFLPVLYYFSKFINKAFTHSSISWHASSSSFLIQIT